MVRALITVLGGAGLEVHCTLERTLSHREPNPAMIHTTFGGGGYSLSRDLVQLGIDCRLITLFGKDQNGLEVQRELSEAGVDVSGSEFGESPTPTTVMMWDEHGQPAMNTYDTRLLEEMTPDFLASRLPLIKNSTAVFFDANLSKESIRFITEKVQVPLFATGVSAGKCMRLIPILPNLFGIRLNLLEARRVTGKISPADCARELCAKGIKIAMITLGAEGALMASGKDVIYADSRRHQCVSPNGAGDAVSAAMIWGFLNRLRLRDIADSTMAAAALTRMGADAVNPELNEAFLLNDLGGRPA